MPLCKQTAYVPDFGHHDTGDGIAAEFHREIFEEFVRVDPSSSGMGLGLANNQAPDSSTSREGVGGQRTWPRKFIFHFCCRLTSE